MPHISPNATATLSQSDQIALGISIPFGLLSIIIAIAGILWSRGTLRSTVAGLCRALTIIFGGIVAGDHIAGDQFTASGNAMQASRTNNRGTMAYNVSQSMSKQKERKERKINLLTAPTDEGDDSELRKSIADSSSTNDDAQNGLQKTSNLPKSVSPVQSHHSPKFQQSVDDILGSGSNSQGFYKSHPISNQIQGDEIPMREYESNTLTPSRHAVQTTLATFVSPAPGNHAPEPLQGSDEDLGSGSKHKSTTPTLTLHIDKSSPATFTPLTPSDNSPKPIQSSDENPGSRSKYRRKTATTARHTAQSLPSPGDHSPEPLQSTDGDLECGSEHKCKTPALSLHIVGSSSPAPGDHSLKPLQNSDEARGSRSKYRRKTPTTAQRTVCSSPATSAPSASSDHSPSSLHSSDEYRSSRPNSQGSRKSRSLSPRTRAYKLLVNEIERTAPDRTDRQGASGGY